MAYKIGFTAQHSETKPQETEYAPIQVQTAPRKSVVSVHFAERNTTLAYYNDRFDLKDGDLVYVEGSMEGVCGRVCEVNYNFKIKLSDYKRVIAVIDTNVSGRFYIADTHFVTFDREALPSAKAATWFCAPSKEDDEIVSGCDESAFRLARLSGINVSPQIAERGYRYFVESRVKYLSLNGNKGYAIVKGSEAYEVEFTYRDGEISELVCSCFCAYRCKHEFAAMLQLSEMLELIEENYAEEFERSGYFAAAEKGTLFSFAVDSKEKGSFVL